METAQDQLVAKKDEQTVLHRKRVIYKRPSDRVASNKVSDEIAQIEAQIKELQVKLADLQKSADEVAGPADWRKYLHTILKVKADQYGQREGEPGSSSRSSRELRESA